MSGRIIREGSLPANRLPIVGKVKVGEKRVSGRGKEYPAALDYFKPTGTYAQMFTEALGEKPQRIPIVFIDDEPKHSCNERWEGRDKAGKLYGKGDGVNWELWDGEQYAPADRQQDAKRFKSDGSGPIRWSVVLTLRFLIPSVPVMGLWELSTKGVASSVDNIRDCYDTVLNHAGTVQRIPFELVVTMAQSQKPGKANKYPVISMVVNLNQEHLVKVPMLDGGALKRIPVLTPELIETNTK